jgi:hypothetical protein
MYELKKEIGKVFTSKFVGTGPSSYKKKKKRIYRAAVSHRFEKHWSIIYVLKLPRFNIL